MMIRTAKEDDSNENEFDGFGRGGGAARGDTIRGCTRHEPGRIKGHRIPRRRVAKGRRRVAEGRKFQSLCRGVDVEGFIGTVDF
jgi:hypothetical protein